MDRQTTIASRLGIYRVKMCARAVAAFSVCLLAFYTIHWSTRLTHGFAMYYTYSSMVLHGEDFSKTFDPAYFNTRIADYGVRGVVDMPNNPPTASLTMLVLAVLQPATAKAVWSAVSFMLLGASILVLIRAYGVEWRGITCAVIVALCFLWHPVYENIAFGQVYILLLFLFSFALYGIRSGSPLMTALSVSFSFILKGYGLLVMLWLGLNHMKKTLLFIGISIVLVYILTVPIFPFQVWSNYWEKGVANLMESPSNAHVAYQTITGFVNHLFHYDQQWSPHPVVPLSRMIVLILAVLLNLFVIGGVLFDADKKRGNTNMLLAFCAAVAVGVITSPVAEEYHYTLFIPLVVGLSITLFADIQRSGRLTIEGIVFIASVLLLAAPLRYKMFQSSSFPLILLAYPKLYGGAAILWYYKRVVSPRNALN